MDKYEQLYLENEKLVYKFGYDYSCVYNEDMMQVLRIALYKACKTYNEDKGIQFSTYAYKCMLNAYNYSFRSKDLKYQYVDDSDYYFSKIDNGEDIEKAIENKELMELIMNYINKLPSLERYVVYQNIINGVPISKLRDKTTYSKNDIYNIVNKHKNTLQKLINNYLH